MNKRSSERAFGRERKWIPLASVVVSATLAAAAELHLEALEVRAVLDNLDETLRDKKEQRRHTI